MEEWVAIAKLEDVPVDGMLSVAHQDKKIVVFRAGEKVYALEDWCPHIGAMLSKGTREQLMITCPLHGVVYSITTGAALSDENWGPARRFPVRVQGEDVEVDWAARRYAIPHP